MSLIHTRWRVLARRFVLTALPKMGYIPYPKNAPANINNALMDYRCVLLVTFLIQWLMNAPSPSKVHACSEEGYYPYPGVCSALYFLCIGGNSFSEFCPSDTVFDPSTSNYQSIETVSCTPGLETTTSAITNPPGLTTYSNTTITPTATTIPATTTTTIQQLQL